MFSKPRFFNLSLNGDSSIDYELLTNLPFNPPHASQMMSYGFISPLSYASSTLSHTALGYTLISFRIDKKIIPAATVKDKLLQRVSELEEQTGHPLSKKEVRDLKSTIVDSLKKDAFCKPKIIDAILSPCNKFLVVDASSDTELDLLISTLIKVLGNISISNQFSEPNVSTVISDWFKSNNFPSTLSVGQDCIIKSYEDNPSTISCSKEEDLLSEMESHLDSNRKITTLSFTWKDKFTLTLDEKKIVKKFAFLNPIVIEDCDDKVQLIDFSVVEHGKIFKELFSALTDWFQSAGHPAEIDSTDSEPLLESA